MVMNYKGFLYRRFGKKPVESEFYVRLYNTTASTVNVNFSDLISNGTVERTGDPVLTSAVVERSGGIEDNVLNGQSLNTFSVAVNESCVFRMKWQNGLFCLKGNNPNSYAQLARSAGYNLKGNYNIPANFMYSLFRGCVNYNQQPGDIFDVSGLTPMVVGNTFMGYTWAECTSLTTAVVPDTSNWHVTTGSSSLFLFYTWAECTSLTTAVVPDITNWYMTHGVGTLWGTWYNCTSLTTAVVPNTTNWVVNSTLNNFLHETWYGCSSLTTAVVPDTSNWRPIGGLADFMGSTWEGCTSLTTAVVPNTTNWPIYGWSGSPFMWGTWKNCTSLTTAVVPDTSNWRFDSMSNYFMSQTWYGCTSLTTAVVPNTTNWGVVIGIADYFMSQTWYGCTSLTTAVVPNTANWSGFIADYFMSQTWYGCTSLTTAVVPNTTNFFNTPLPMTNYLNNFLTSTWENCTALTTAVAPDTTKFFLIPPYPSTIMLNTWTNAFPTSGGAIVTLKGNFYVSTTPLATNSAGITNARVTNIKVDSGLVTTYRSSSSWTNISPNTKFISW